ncbi:MAG: hydrogenase maturation nickel metallochaperone HypA [Vicinamibacterales bacterium]
MHELGIACSVFDIVRQHVPDARAGDVRAVRVRVGDLAGVLPDSLDFCFRAIVSESPYAGAFLRIERIAARCRCSRCWQTFTLDAPAFVCPACLSPVVTLVEGEELQVVDLELDESGAETP